MSKKTKQARTHKITGLVKSLSGIVKLPADYNHKKEYALYLVEKYSR